jgi:hypothetical protein
LSERIASTQAYGAGWIGEEFSSLNHVLIRRYPVPFLLGQAQAANLDTTLLIPYPHRIQHIQIKHCDASDAENATAFTWRFDRLKWKNEGVNVYFQLWGGAASTEIDEWFTGCTCVVFPQGEYRLRISGTENHHFYFEIVIQILSKKGPETPYKGLWKTPRSEL